MSRFGTEERAFAEVPIYPFFFDVIHVDGVDLMTSAIGAPPSTRSHHS